MKQRRKPEPVTPQRFEFFRQELDVDVEAVYNRLKNVATLSREELRDKHAISNAINSAARNSVDARKLYLIARRERELFKIEKARSMRRMTREATERINRWMTMNGIAKKQITVAMVMEEIAASDDLRAEYKILVERELELRDIRDVMQTLANEWSSRKSTLQTQARLLAAQKEVVL